MVNKMEIMIRKIKQEEYPLLEDYLYDAIFIPEGVQPPDKSIINNEDLQVYIRDFGTKKDDICFLAEEYHYPFKKRIQQCDYIND